MKNTTDSYFKKVNLLFISENEKKWNLLDTFIIIKYFLESIIERNGIFTQLRSLRPPMHPLYPESTENKLCCGGFAFS